MKLENGLHTVYLVYNLIVRQLLPKKGQSTCPQILIHDTQARAKRTCKAKNQIKIKHKNINKKDKYKIK